MGSFVGLPHEPVCVDVVHVGAVFDHPDRARGAIEVPTRGLGEGAQYEFEGVLSTRPDRSATAAAVQYLRLGCEQLARPVDPELLLERVVKVSHFKPMKVPMLFAAGHDARRRFRLNPPPIGPPIDEDCRPIQEMVALLRSWGWQGGILLPGPIAETYTALVPTGFFADGRMQLVRSVERVMPLDVIEQALGLRFMARERWWRSAVGLSL